MDHVARDWQNKEIDVEAALLIRFLPILWQLVPKCFFMQGTFPQQRVDAELVLSITASEASVPLPHHQRWVNTNCMGCWIWSTRRQHPQWYWMGYSNAKHKLPNFLELSASIIQNTLVKTQYTCYRICLEYFWLWNKNRFSPVSHCLHQIHQWIPEVWSEHQLKYF